MVGEILETVGISFEDLAARGSYRGSCIVRKKPATERPDECHEYHPDCHRCNLALSDHQKVAAVLSDSKTTIYDFYKTIMTADRKNIFEHYGRKGGEVRWLPRTWFW